jgi:hypothetical protein
MGHSDGAKRVSDTYRLHRAADVHGAIGHWFAVRLADGTGDNVLYPSKAEAIAHQSGDYNWYAYIQVVPSDMSPCDAETFLRTQRKLYDAGIQWADPDSRGGGMQPINRLTREDALQSVGLNSLPIRGR